MENNWISVKDKLPEFETNVITYYQFMDGKGEKAKPIHCIQVGYLVQTSKRANNNIRNEWHIEENWAQDRITHWMPLPSPPNTTP